MIDPAKTLRKTLREWGHDVYLQRALGNGNHSVNLERVTTRQVGQSGLANADAMGQFSEGVNIKYDVVYYFEAIVNPKEGDRIYENISSNSHRDYTIFVVQAASPVRGRHGKVVFWTVGASREK